MRIRFKKREREQQKQHKKPTLENNREEVCSREQRKALMVFIYCYCNVYCEPCSPLDQMPTIYICQMLPVQYFETNKFIISLNYF